MDNREEIHSSLRRHSHHQQFATREKVRKYYQASVYPDLLPHDRAAFGLQASYLSLES